MLHGGDLTDFGITKEFLWQRDILNTLNVPWVTVIGNHDCLGSGEQAYEAVFGKQNYHFTAGNVLFVCLNTNAMEFNYSTPVPDFNFLGKLIRNIPPNVEKTVLLQYNKEAQEDFPLYQVRLRYLYPIFRFRSTSYLYHREKEQ